MNTTIKSVINNIIVNNSIDRKAMLNLLENYVPEEQWLHTICLLTNLEDIPEVPEHSKVGVSYKGGIRMETATMVSFDPFAERVRFYVIRFENKWFHDPEDAKKFSENGSYYNMDCNNEENENHPYRGCYSRKHFNEISLEEWLKNA